MACKVSKLSTCSSWIGTLPNFFKSSCANGGKGHVANLPLEHVRLKGVQGTVSGPHSRFGMEGCLQALPSCQVSMEGDPIGRGELR